MILWRENSFQWFPFLFPEYRIIGERGGEVILEGVYRFAVRSAKLYLPFLIRKRKECVLARETSRGFLGNDEARADGVIDEFFRSGGDAVSEKVDFLFRPVFYLDSLGSRKRILAGRVREEACDTEFGRIEFLDLYLEGLNGFLVSVFGRECHGIGAGFFVFVTGRLEVAPVPIAEIPDVFEPVSIIVFPVRPEVERYSSETLFWYAFFGRWKGIAQDIRGKGGQCPAGAPTGVGPVQGSAFGGLGIRHGIDGCTSRIEERHRLFSVVEREREIDIRDDDVSEGRYGRLVREDIGIGPGGISDFPT